MKRSDEITRLLDALRTLEQSPENQRRKQKWEAMPCTGRASWRGLPRHDYSCLNGNVPIFVDQSYPFWAKYFHFSLKDFVFDPEVFLVNFLKIAIEKFKLFDDDFFISRQIAFWMGCGYEASMFGMNVRFSDDGDSWIEYVDVIKKPEDLKSLRVPDFLASGLMPATLRKYETLKELLDDDFDVLFPEWLRGPFGLATYLRGFTHVMMDMFDRPAFVHELMCFLVESRKAWYDELAKYLSRPVVSANLYNDEVNCPALSIPLYETFVLPYEQELCRYHNGFHYWHSCGDVGRLYASIAKIPRIDLIHKGPWTSTKEAGKVFGNRAPIEVCLNPQSDLCEGTEESMKETVGSVVRDLTGARVCGYSISANNMEVYGSFENSVKKGRMFIKSAREAIEKCTRGMK